MIRCRAAVKGCPRRGCRVGRVGVRIQESARRVQEARVGKILRGHDEGTRPPERERSRGGHTVAGCPDVGRAEAARLEDITSHGLPSGRHGRGRGSRRGHRRGGREDDQEGNRHRRGAPPRERSLAGSGEVAPGFGWRRPPSCRPCSSPAAVSQGFGDHAYSQKSLSYNQIVTATTTTNCVPLLLRELFFHTRKVY